MVEENEDQIAGVPAAAFARAADQVRIRTDRFRQIYANNMQLSMSSWDVSITFGEIVGEQEGKSVIEEISKVVMTREIMKILSVILSARVADFEKDFGEIKIPATFTKRKPTSEDVEGAEAIKSKEPPPPGSTT